MPEDEATEVVRTPTPGPIETLPSKPSKPSLALSAGGMMMPQTFEEAYRMAEMFAASKMVPELYRREPANVLVAMQMGAEVGLGPMQSLQGIIVVNGQPSLWGDIALGVVLRHPRVRDVLETEPSEENDFTATCTVVRTDRKPVTRRFSLADAKAAGLTSKKGPWQGYRDRMISHRARSWALRDACADVLKGLAIAEEAIDYEAIAPASAEDGSGRPALVDLNREILEAGDAALEAAQAPPRAARAPAPERTAEEAPSSDAKATEATEADPGCRHTRESRITLEDGRVGCGECGEILEESASKEPSVGDVLNALQRAESLDEVDAALDLARGLPDEKRVAVDKKAAAVRKRLGG